MGRLATLAMIAALTVGACGNGSTVGDGGPAGPTPVEAPSVPVSAELEELIDSLAVPDDHWAGARVLDDGRVEVGLTPDAPVPPELVRPDIEIVRRRFSTRQLGAASDEVGSMFEPGDPTAPVHWWVAVRDNVVWVQFHRELSEEQVARGTKVLQPLIDRGLVRVDPKRGEYAGDHRAPPEPDFALSLEAPATVAVETVFEVRLVSDVPAEELSTYVHEARLRRNGKIAWIVWRGDAVRSMPREGLATAEGFFFRGPWTFKAPPEAGTYELCMDVNRLAPGSPESEPGHYVGFAHACTPIEVTAA